MLQDVNESDYQALKTELANFTLVCVCLEVRIGNSSNNDHKMLAKKEKKAGVARTEFSKLADDVYLFGTHIDLAIEDAEEHIKVQIHATQHTIADLHVRLQK